MRFANIISIVRPVRTSALRRRPSWRACLCAASVFVAASPDIHAADDRGKDALQARCQVLRVQLLQARTRLLKEDPRIARLNKKIQDLYREMDALMSAHPRVRELSRQLQKVERELDTDGNGSFVAE